VHVLLTVHWHERSVPTVLDRYKATLWRPEEKGELPTGVHAEIVKGGDWVEALFFLERIEPWSPAISSSGRTAASSYR